MKGVAMIIRGKPGAGKTTVARGLACRLHKHLGETVMHIEIDDIRHMFVSSVDVESLWPRAVLPMLESLGDICRFAIIEGVFAEADTIRQIENRLSRSLVVRLDVHSDVCIARNNERHLADERLSVEELLLVASCLEPYPEVQVSGDETFDGVVEPLFRLAISLLT